MAKSVFTNPPSYRDGVTRTNPDPFLVNYFGTYYCYSTAEAGVNVSISTDMVTWEYKGFCFQEPGRSSYWAPCVIYRNGLFYMYVSDRPEGTEDPHLQRMRVATSNSPTGPFTFRKQLADFFAIDADVVTGDDGKMVMFYASNELTAESCDKTGTSVVVDTMADPFTLEGNPKPVILPSIDEEIFERDRFHDGQDWYTIEGSTYFRSGAYAFQTYSGNAYENPDYFIGLAAAEATPTIYDLEWAKVPSESQYAPLIRKNEYVEGTGHNSIVRGPNLIDLWINYHGRDCSEPRMRGAEQRKLYLDRLFEAEDKILCAGPTAFPERVPEKPTFSGNGCGSAFSDYTLAKDLRSFESEFYMRAEVKDANMSTVYDFKLVCNSGSETHFAVNPSGVHSYDSDSQSFIPFPMPTDLQAWQPWRISRSTRGLDLSLGEVTIAHLENDHSVPCLLSVSTDADAELGYWRVTTYEEADRAVLEQRGFLNDPGDDSATLKIPLQDCSRIELIFSSEAKPNITVRGETASENCFICRGHTVWSGVVLGDEAESMQIVGELDNLLKCRITNIPIENPKGYYSKGVSSENS